MNKVLVGGVVVVLLAVPAVVAETPNAWVLVPSSSAVLTTGAPISALDIGVVVRGLDHSDFFVAISGHADDARITRYEVQRILYTHPNGDYTSSPFFNLKANVTSIEDVHFRHQMGAAKAATALVAERMSFVPDHGQLSISRLTLGPVLKGGIGETLDHEHGTMFLPGQRIALSTKLVEGQASGKMSLYLFNGTIELTSSTKAERLQSTIDVVPVGPTASLVTTVWYELEADGADAFFAARSQNEGIIDFFARELSLQHVNAISVDRPIRVEGDLAARTDASLWMEGLFESTVRGEDPNDADTYRIEVHGNLRHFSVGGGVARTTEWPAIAMSGLLVAGIVAITLIRFLAGGALLPIYTKLKKDKLLNIPARDTIFRVIQQAPGIHFVELQKQVGSLNGTGNPIGFGALSYHLSQMERFELIVSKREGRFRRYFDVGANMGADTARVALLQTNPVSLIAKAVLDSPGLNQGDLHARVTPHHAMTRQALSYHLRRLADKELVAIDANGRFLHYRPTERLTKLAVYLGPPTREGPSAPRESLAAA